jgi:anaerobic ribonucleoside-triphosphate reductase activating protein
MDISNGPGVRVSLFMQGCAFHCKNCFNKETWDFDGGNELTDEVIDEIMELCKKSHIKGLSILGGEPWHPRNVDTTVKIVKRFKEELPDKTIWSWSGFTFENYLSKIDGIEYVDVIVDGQFVEELKDISLRWKGSSNQRVINVKESLKNNQVVLCEE